MNLIINGISLIADNFITTNFGFAVDAHTSEKNLNDQFIPLLKSNPKEVHFSLDNVEYDGRFGRILFDNSGFIRLYLVKKDVPEFKNEDHFVQNLMASDPTYLNLVKAVKDYKNAFSKLFSIMQSKNILSESEAEQIQKTLPKTDVMFSRVDDLQEYQRKFFETLDDVKDRTTSN